MVVQPLTQSERDQLLADHAAALRSYERARAQADRPAARAAFADAERIARQYFDRLPRPALAVCPLCHQTLHRSFDPYGFDGLWWRKAAEPPEPPACPHFCLLRGAVHLHGRPPRAGADEVRPGPEVPYVIPRILDLPDMLMVIGQLEMTDGYTAYPLAYFASRRPPLEQLTAGWARSMHTWRKTTGEGGWDLPNDPWDFELHPWLARGKVRWCEPDSGNQRLSTAAADQCPYLNLPGERQDRSIRRDVATLIGVPDGQPFFPID